jgi:hypothetical protein
MLRLLQPLSHSTQVSLARPDRRVTPERPALKALKVKSERQELRVK